MGIERTAKRVIKKRSKDDLIKKHEKIGKLLGLETVPLHELAWKEPRLGLGTGDCYPLIDVVERVAEIVGGNAPPELSGDDYACECGFKAKTKAGLVNHRRKCEGG